MVIRAALGSKEGEVLMYAHKIQITVKDINTLTFREIGWVNDEVINFYMQVC